MTTLQPRIFIGSSKEAESIAKFVCKELSDFADCTIWTDAFKYGNSSYEDLLNMLSLFDYGVLIATADDITRFRKKSVVTPRDNVIFEYGLFAGRLGRTRAFLLTETGAKLPSDLLGVSLPFFPSKKGRVQNDGLRKSCSGIKQHIFKRTNIFDFGFLPSTALGFGYFKNFVSKAVAHLIHTKKINLANGTDIAFKKVDFTILIPDNLSSDMFDKIGATRLAKNWQTVKVDAGAFRPFDFSIDMAKSKKGVLYLCDIPITLNSLREAILLYSQKTHIGKSEVEQLLEEREIRTFKQVLDYLIEQDPYTKGKVKTEIVPI